MDIEISPDEWDIAHLLKDEILDAIAILTDTTVGDVYYKIQEGKFEEVAVEALMQFTKNFHLIEKKSGDSNPLEDVEILQQCLEELVEELAIAEKNKADPKIITELKLDILGMRRRINLEKNV